jgi:hypothetical protein
VDKLSEQNAWDIGVIKFVVRIVASGLSKSSAFCPSVCSKSLPTVKWPKLNTNSTAQRIFPGVKIWRKGDVSVPSGEKSNLVNSHIQKKKWLYVNAV